MALRVAVSGSGQMGAQILTTLAAANDIEIVGVLEKFSKGEQYELSDGYCVPLRQTVGGLRDFDADVVVDFSNAVWTAQLLPIAIEIGVCPVVGTSGLEDTLIEQSVEACAAKQLGGVVATNFALGAVLLMHLSQVAAPFFDAVEIIEQHHDGKVDAPSGTAITTARSIRESRGRDFSRNTAEQENLSGARGAELGGVTIHSVRLPGLVAHQEVIFGGSGETLKLRHDSMSRESFMPGVLRAVRSVPKFDHLVIGLDQLLGLQD